MQKNILRKHDEDAHKVMASLKVKNSNEKINKGGLTFGDKISVRVTKASGSWVFIIGLWFFIFGWMMIQHIMGIKAFDPYPYILLNLCISVICVLQNPFILQSQNIQTKEDHIRADADYETNIKNLTYLEHLHTTCDDLKDKVEKQEILLNDQSQRIEQLINMVSDLKEDKLKQGDNNAN